jgi:dolichol-phosphate mannosyltransferase
MAKLISLVVPAYNEAECVDELARRISAVFDLSLGGRYDFEAIIVENGSADDTYEKLLAIRAADPRFKIVRLSRNFDMEGGMTAGLTFAKGDAAIIMSADLQDPPEMIPAFLEKWEQGFENVYGVITRRTDNSLFRRAAAATFYWIINRFADQPVPRNASDFRLVDRKAYESFNTLPERNRMLRAMWGWIGFRSCGIEMERPPRFGGVTAFNTLRTAGFAIKGILASSYTPLKFIPLMGISLSALAFVVFAGLVVKAFVFGVPFSGFGTIVGLILLLFGLLFLFLGIVSEYVGMIFEEVRRRPSFIVRNAEGIETDVSAAPAPPAARQYSGIP